MKTILKLAFLPIAIALLSVSTHAQSSKYKCMLQMSNYMGEGAYVVVSLVTDKGDYVKTLYVMGDDKKWNKFYTKRPANISAITGASVTGGDRSVNVIEIENSKINSGFKLRFETAVEDQKYHVNDVEVPLTTAGIAAKSEGKGYIRYVRLIKI
jgi:hypothetical protein